MNAYLRNAREIGCVEIAKGGVAGGRIHRIEFGVIEHVDRFELERGVKAFVYFEVLRERTVQLRVAGETDIARTRIMPNLSGLLVGRL